MTVRSRIRFFVSPLLASFVLGFGATAAANPDPPALQDARSGGLAGAAVAYNNSGTGIFHNAALMDTVDSAVATASFTLFRPDFGAPLLGPGTDVGSESDVEPVVSVGGGVRLHERVFLGLGFSVTGGVGGRFSVMDQEVESLIGVAEIAVPVTVRIVDGLALSLGWRGVLARAQQTQLVPNPVDPSMMVPLEQELTGFSPLGLQAGILYRPLDNLNLGFSYRSRVTIDLDGTATLGNIDADSESEFSVPHTFRLGAALWLLERQLMLTSEVVYQLFSDSGEALPQRLTVPPMGPGMDPLVIEQNIDLSWNDTISAKIGAEYAIIPAVIARLGYHFGTSSVPESHAGAFFPSPGLTHAFTVGAGFRHEWLEVDLSFLYGFVRSTVEETPANGFSGDYTTDNILGTLSVTYRHPSS